jgi:hypothetical protein
MKEYQKLSEEKLREIFEEENYVIEERKEKRIT